MAYGLIERVSDIKNLNIDRFVSPQDLIVFTNFL
jgi:hypothetical protein